MESFLQKWGWVGHLLVIAIVATLLAVAMNKFIAIQLAPLTVPELPSFAKKAEATQKTTTKKPRARSYSRAIVDRCLFGCEEESADPNTCDPECEAGEQCQAGTCVPVDPNANVPSELPVASDLKVKLLGAMVAAEPEYSLALFSDPAAKANFILSVGDRLLGEGEIVEIRRDRVIIRRNGRLEYVKLEDSLGGAPTLTSLAATLPPGATDIKRVPSAAIPSKDEAAEEEEEASDAASPGEEVRKVGENEYELDRGAVQRQLNDAQALAQGAKVIPNYTDGKRNGIKLVGVKGDSVYQQLGIESGDVVKAINGTDIKSQAHALELLQGMRKASSASIEVERRGQKKTLKYKLK